MPRYQIPPGVDGVNIGGQQFNADSSGIVDLPDDCNVPGDFIPAGASVLPTETIHQPVLAK
jgi:hypothetical protein